MGSESHFISHWLEQPKSLRSNQQEHIKELSAQYPLFYPLLFLNSISRYHYQEAPLQVLYELYPTNRVLIQELFEKSEKEETEEAIDTTAQVVIDESGNKEKASSLPTDQIKNNADSPATPDEPSRDSNESSSIPVSSLKDTEGSTPVTKEATNSEAELVANELDYPPASSANYLESQGLTVDSDIPEDLLAKDHPTHHDSEAEMAKTDQEKDLMVIMSFAEWLNYLKGTQERQKKEEESKKALHALWQKERLKASIEEEDLDDNETIPEEVFQMAINSITQQDELLSESMASVYVIQGKKEKAIEMYQKLSLLNPEKSSYFAAKIEELQKELDI